ncbi:rRNA pseudouridine synthase [Candidatus Woesearchaeota archaeon]|nr:rRNA pseudouridine synthase [Candidatus Woesearchaeota archaeon]
MLQRLQKILASAGIASRRKCEDLIISGKVKVNGQIATIGQQADAERDSILVDDQNILLEKKVYLILHKPQGYVTTVNEPFGMRKVTELIKVKERVYPVGRLDKDTSGILFFTNDGALAHKLLHPSFGVDKTYLVGVDKAFGKKELEVMQQGILVDGRKVAVKAIKLPAPFKISITIHEGRKHIVKRLFEVMGYQVKELCRVSFGPLKLGNLKLGQWRYLNKEEVEELKSKT